MAELRANQSKRTLLHYLVEQLHRIDTNLLSIKDELDAVVKAADAESMILLYNYIAIINHTVLGITLDTSFLEIV